MTDSSNKIKKFSLYYRFKFDTDTPTYNGIDGLTNPFTQNSHTVLPLTYGPERQMELLGNGNDNIITYHSVRIPVTNTSSPVSLPMYKEFLHISQPDGTLNAYSIYPDTGSADATSAAKTSWTILGASGIYSNINYATITYDNEGVQFGYEFSRKIDLYEIPNGNPTTPAPTTPTTPTTPTVPTTPSIPTIPTVPTLPAPTVPTLPTPTVPTVPTVPTLPVPTVPTLPVPTVPTLPAPTVPTLPAPTLPTVPTLPPYNNERCCEELESLKQEVKVLVNTLKRNRRRNC